MYDLNNAQDVIKQMRDANLVDYQIEDILRDALEELRFKRVCRMIARKSMQEFKEFMEKEMEEKE